MRLIFVIAATIFANNAFAGRAPASVTDCPNIQYTGYTLQSDGTRVTESLTWSKEDQAYYVQGPFLSMHFFYPSEPNTDRQSPDAIARVYKIPIGQPIPPGVRPACEEQVSFKAYCGWVADGSGEFTQAFVFSYSDSNCQQYETVTMKAVPLTTKGGGVELTTQNAFGVYDFSGVSLHNGEKVSF